MTGRGAWKKGLGGTTSVVFTGASDTRFYGTQLVKLRQAPKGQDAH